MNTKILIFFFILFFVIKTEAQSRFKAGVKLGVSTSQVDGDTYGGFDKAGVAGGVTLNSKINEKWAAQFEMLFVQKGSKHVGDANKGDYTYYLMKLNYIEVPLLLKYTQKKFTFEAGPGFGYLISAKEEDAYSVIYNTVPFYKTEVSASIGINYQIYKNLGINWRYTNSLLPIRNYASGASFWYNPGQRNSVITFTATYFFGSAESK
jgi:Outer membrane protein beta-barrel domain